MTEREQRRLEHYRSRSTVYAIGFGIALLAAIVASIAYVGADGRRAALQGENDGLNAAVVSLQARNNEAEVLRQDFCESQVGDQLAWHDAQTVREGQMLTSTISCGLLDGSVREFTLTYDLGASVFESIQ